jgi:RHS repeat-associated protein
MKTYIGEIGGRTMKSLFFHNALLTSALFLVLLISGLPHQALAGVNIYFVHNDHLGTPVAVTDQSQAVVWEADKKPFGESVTTGTIGENTRFPGQLFDEETGLHYNYFRDYDPSLGRYIQSDPIGLRGGLNTYAYVGGNPLMYTDPKGLETYQCTRNLQVSGFKIPRAGPLFHQYVCVGNADNGYACGGLAPSGRMFDSPGEVHTDPYSPAQCEETQPENKCIESCITRKLSEPPPNYSVDLSKGQNCQTYADYDLEYACVLECR